VCSMFPPVHYGPPSYPYGMAGGGPAPPRGPAAKQSAQMRYSDMVSRGGVPDMVSRGGVPDMASRGGVVPGRPDGGMSGGGGGGGGGGGAVGGYDQRYGGTGTMPGPPHASPVSADRGGVSRSQPPYPPASPPPYGAAADGSAPRSERYVLWCRDVVSPRMSWRLADAPVVDVILLLLQVHARVIPPSLFHRRWRRRWWLSDVECARACVPVTCRIRVAVVLAIVPRDRQSLMKSRRH
jgi:hypothetical protein